MLDRGSLHSNLPEGPNQRTGSSTSSTLSAHPILFTHLFPSRPMSREEKSGPTPECFALIPPFYKTKLPKTNKKTNKKKPWFPLEIQITVEIQRNIHSQKYFSWLLQHPNLCLFDLSEEECVYCNLLIFFFFFFFYFLWQLSQ